MKAKFIFFTIFILFFSNIYSQTKDDLKELYIYSHLLLEFEHPSNQIKTINEIKKNNSYAKYFQSDNSIETNILLIDSIFGYKIFVVSFPPPNQYYDFKMFWAYKEGSIYKINRERVDDFINKFLYRYYKQIGKEKIIEFYNKITFWGIKIDFYDQFDPKIYGIIEEYETYHRFFEKDDFIYMKKLYDIEFTTGIEKHIIFYNFYWNKFIIRDIMTSKN